ncbi:hypothetical protein T440DRAFT_514565 [Plenodomus tracheiphilus IPT5]|uniref:Probable double zinc ribbon domain-containing protein n=1 Tax=Plenodomus tracheiphilus IPT5 TaxID=1408161 RepID=A0A6A7BGM1_9PLEO|nr:hypothetical protein T440DRAFT_514565 [Plenodomus tracheiphilus IPT5]
MSSRLRKKVSQYFSSPLARFQRNAATEANEEAAPDAPVASSPRPPNRIVMNAPEASLSVPLPSNTEFGQGSGRDSLGGETSTSSGQLSGETLDTVRAVTDTKEIIPTPAASESSVEQSMGPSAQFHAADSTVTIGYRYSSEVPATGMQPETGKARTLTPITVAATSHEHAVAPSTLSSEVVAPTHSDGTPLKSIGKWGCCRCKRVHDIYYFTEGEHPVSILNCDCTHRSCGKCALQGQMKVFQPMTEPEVIQLSEDGSRQIRFGVFCDGCGSSWKAVEVIEEIDKKSLKQQISNLPKQVIKHVNPLRKLRQHSSMVDLSSRASDEEPRSFQSTLNLRALSNEMEAEGHGKQAELATVHFTGIKCTCGLVSCSTSLCFQVVDPPKDVYETEFEELMAGRKVAGFGTTPEDQARGHQTPVLTLRGKKHPNPLRSCPVIDE